MAMQLAKNSPDAAGQLPHAAIQIASDPAEARRIQDEIEALLKAHQFSEHDIFGIRLALEEALINAIKHGNRMDRSKKVEIAFHVSTELFEICIADQGQGFDPGSIPDPTADENLERPCGRGLMLMKHYMTFVAYNTCGNSVHMRKVRNGQR